MSIYSLTETYSEIYDHRKVEDLFDNLRFVDYMKDEDIQEVLESLVWEYRDYGNTLEESFDIIEYSLQDQVICESYEELIQDILYEATVTRSTRVPLTSSTGRSSTPSTGSSKITLGRGGMQTPSGTSKVTSSNRFDQNEVSRRANRIARIRSAKQSVKSRISSLSGPISSVKQSISGAAGGMGRAAKALGGAAVEKGKVMLKSLLRRGGKAVKNVGKSIEASGRRAAEAPPTTRTAKVGGTTFTATSEPGGKKRQMVGSAVKRVGKAIQRMGKSPKQASQKDKTPQMKALPPARPETETRRAAVQRKLDTAAKGSTGSEMRTSSPRLALPAKTSGQPAVERTISARKREAASRLQAAATGSKARGIRFAGPKTIASQRAHSGVKEKLAKFAKTLNKEDYEILVDYIIEDIISTGYAIDEMSALDILETLSENTVCDIALEYLND
jgi:hypothetical protein